MKTNLAYLLNLLTVPPGDLIYHLVTSVTLIVLVSVILIKHREAAMTQKRSLLIGGTILIIIQFFLIAFRFIIFKPNFYNSNIFVIIERLAASLTIIWLVWSFINTRQRKLPTILFSVLSVFLIVISLIFIFAKSYLAGIPFLNPKAMDFIWQIIALVLIIIGVIFAFSYRPPMAKVLILMLILLAVGHFVQIIMIHEMNGQMGAVRFSHILAFPWLLAMLKLFSTNNAHVPLERKQTPIKNASNALRVDDNAKGIVEMTADTKPDLVNLLLKINTAQTTQEKCQTIAQALSLSVIADICFLVKTPEEKEKIHIICGYDLIREAALKPDILASEDLPNILKAWEAQQILILSHEDAALRDAQTLSMLLNYHTVGNLLAYPLGSQGGVFFLSPYTGKRWTDKTFQLLNQIKDTLSSVLFTPEKLVETDQVTHQVQSQINTLILSTENLRAALADKENQLQEKDVLIKGLKAKYQIDKMEAMTQLEKMKQEIADLHSQIATQPDFASQIEQLQKEILDLSNEREQLQLELNRTKNMLRDLQTETGQTGPIRLSLESQVISLDSIAANARLRAAQQLQEHKIDLEIQNPDGRYLIKTDPELLQTALYELLTNAILASGIGGTIRLEQQLSLEMGMLTVQITDFGEGLTQAEQSALFSAQHESIPGIGSVQAIRNAIRAIRVLNGKIWLKSKKVSYTTFRFQIPVRIID
jgi:signal transduction histidine kinase